MQYLDTQDTDYVKNLCELDPECTGYYSNGNGWHIATYKDPSECDSVADSTGFTRYFKKPEYNIANNEQGKYGCQLKMSNVCENKLCPVGNYVEKLCDLDTKCIGYYTNSDKSKMIATEKDVNTDTSSCDNNLLYNKVSDLNIFNRKTPA
jgi:hypothetical protein